jgi:hypothetical protein
MTRFFPNPNYTPYVHDTHLCLPRINTQEEHVVKENHVQAAPPQRTMYAGPTVQPRPAEAKVCMHVPHLSNRKLHGRWCTSNKIIMPIRMRHLAAIQPPSVQTRKHREIIMRTLFSVLKKRAKFIRCFAIKHAFDVLICKLTAACKHGKCCQTQLALIWHEHCN